MRWKHMATALMKYFCEVVKVSKKYFDLNLYLEGLKQLRLPGFILSIITFIGSAVIPITIWSANRTYLDSYPITALEAMPLVIFYMYLAPFLLCMSLFSFLNKRSSSDFYHSIPNTRISLYTSFCAAVLTWTAVTIMITVLSTSFLYAMLGMRFSLNYVPYMIFTFIAGAVLIQGAILVAMSATGTLMNNVLIFLLLLFLPRLLCLSFSSTLKGLLQIVNLNEFGIIGNMNLNIPFKFILCLPGLYVFPSYDLFTYIPGIIYTFVLGVIYLILAGLIFKCRKSESAGKSSPNKILQHVYRCAITLPITLIIPCALVSSSGEVGIGTLTGVVTASIIIYFVYELITTKRLKNLITAAPFILVIVIFDILFGASMSATRSKVLNTVPEPQEIEWVSFTSRSSFSGVNMTEKFHSILQERVRYNDTELLLVLSDGLRDTLDSIEMGKYKQNDNQVCVVMELKGGRTIERIISLNDYDMGIVNEKREEHIEYIKAYSELPNEESIQNITFGNLSKADSRMLYDAFKKEFALLGPEDANMIINPNNIAINSLPEPIYVSGYLGVRYYNCTLYLSQLMPKTMQLAVDLSYKDNANLYNCADRIQNTTVNQINYYVYSFNTSNNIYISTDLKKESENSKLKKIADIIKGIQLKPVDITQPFIYLDIFVYYGDDTHDIGKYYLPVSAADIAKLTELKESLEDDLLKIR